jgi:hypothetical protein
MVAPRRVGGVESPDSAGASGSPCPWRWVYGLADGVIGGPTWGLESGTPS